MAVPIYADLFFSPGFHYFIQNKSDQGKGAGGSGVSGGVADHDGARAATDRRRIEALDRSGSQRVVSSVTYMASRPRETTNFTAFSVVWRRKSSVQFSV